MPELYNYNPYIRYWWFSCSFSSRRRGNLRICKHHSNSFGSSILRARACQFGARSDGGVAVAMKTIDLPKCPFDGKDCERFGACDVSWFEADKPIEQLSRCSRFKPRKALGEAERK